MKNDTMQQELFKEFEAPKRKKGASYSILPKNYILFNISYEQIIFIAIAVIMLLVLVFSLGVERGKRLISAEIKRQNDSLSKAAAVGKTEEGLKKEVGPTKTPEAPKAEAVDAAIRVEQPLKGPIEEKKVASPEMFTVQVIAYRSKKSAQEELVKLSKKGFNPFIIIGGGYYQICVGEYKNRNEANGDLSELRKVYKDSFVRKR